MKENVKCARDTKETMQWKRFLKRGEDINFTFQCVRHQCYNRMKENSKSLGDTIILLYRI